MPELSKDEIVEKLVNRSPFYMSRLGERYCFFCQKLQQSEDDERHAPDCLFVAAREMAQEMAS
jgi:hypothetical protein